MGRYNEKGSDGMKKHPDFLSLDKAEQKDRLLRILKRGHKIQPLAEALSVHASTLEKYLDELRRDGRVRCTNKTWYRSDALTISPATGAA